MKFFFLSAVLVSVTLFSSCKKKEEVIPSPVTQLLTSPAKGWKIIEKSVIDGGSPVSVFDPKAVCINDNLEIYKADGNKITDEGAEKCSSNAPHQTNDGMWSLSADGTILTVKDGSYTGTYTILEINATSLKLTQDDNGIIYYINYIAQ